MAGILVTGASGFIGRNVISAFTTGGCHFLRVAVRRKSILPFAGRIEIVQHSDLNEPVDWLPLLKGINTVIHLAGVAHTRGAEPATYDRVNRRTTEQLALAAVRSGVSRFVFISSIRAQSGPSADHLLTEGDPALPTDHYGRSKLAAETAVRSSGVPFTILRPVLLYGPDVKGNFATLMRMARSPWPVPLRLFTNRRSLLDINNFVSALSFVCSTPHTLGETYLVADPGQAPTLCEVIATMRQADGREPLLFSLPTSLFSIPLRLMGQNNLRQTICGDLQVDPNRLIAAGWKPEHGTLAGLSALNRASASDHS